MENGEAGFFCRRGYRDPPRWEFFPALLWPLRVAGSRAAVLCLKLFLVDIILTGANRVGTWLCMQ